MLVLEGNPTLRTPEGSDRLQPWDVVFFPLDEETDVMVRRNSTVEYYEGE